MPRQASIAKDDLLKLSPSAAVRRFGQQIVAAAKGRPILDVACGGGRNAILLAYFGGNVVGLDRDIATYKKQTRRLVGTVWDPIVSKISLMSVDLVHDAWPYKSNEVGGIVNVHFTHVPLFKAFTDSLISGGCLLIETVPAHGQNYIQLPQAGKLRQAFEESFELNVYRERRVGPEGCDAVTVTMFGTRVER